jgi:class 3 adenylate cyclase
MTAAGATCAACGVSLPEAAKFCWECGARLSGAAAPAEYKQVTVLFADVVHSMEIAAAVGAERLREIMAALVERASAVVGRFGGTVDKFTGDGIMAVFGAPVALEDHASRACVAALNIQAEANELAREIEARDGISLRLRIGLNSGEVIAGEIGSGSLGYTAIGEQVGLAQRMESVAPAGGVMLSAPTARLVEDAALLGEPEMVRIKGAEDEVPARRLVGMAAQPRRSRLSQSTLVGRELELSTLTGRLDRSITGRGSVVGVVGPPGIGKTRLTGEVAAYAKAHGVEVFSTYCESHATDVPFNAVARLLGAVLQLDGLDDQTARASLRERFSDADPEDVLLMNDLLNIGDPAVELPKIDPDARRRRLTALVNTAQLARAKPAVFIVEDVHWIDKVSDSMLADYLVVIAQTPSMMLVTYRPEYQGALKNVAGAQTIALAPLSDLETTTLVNELLGPDPSMHDVGAMIAGRAAGNPFFVQEMARDLAERGVLVGELGDYACRTDVAEVSVPATLQATIAARADRLGPAAKHTLAAAAVIGSRFDCDLLASLEIDPVVDELIAAELVDQVRFTPRAEYAFRHPLIRTVAYESQLKADRARLHRRLAAVIEAREPDSAEQNAALIAEHLASAADLHAAYGWHMRAATWATNRDVNAARLSWERAQTIADELPADSPDRAAMRIAPRTMLCGIAYRVQMNVVGERFDELRQLCVAAGDSASLAIGLAGLVADHVFRGRILEASSLASEAWDLAESLGDLTLTVGLSFPLIYAKMENGHWSTALRWSSRVIDLADGDAGLGGFLFGSPLAVAHASRALAGSFLGHRGWRDDQSRSLDIVRNADHVSYATVFGWVYNPAVALGVLSADDATISEIEDALRIAERSGDDFAVALTWVTLGDVLVHRPSAADRDRGEKLLVEVKELFLRMGHNLGEVPIVTTYLARELARRGGGDEALPIMRAAVDDLIRHGQLLSWGVPATAVLAETLLDCGAEADLMEAETAIERLASARADGGLALRDVWVLRLRTLLARARDDEKTYSDLRDRYLDMSKTLGYEGHIAWAEAMP